MNKDISLNDIFHFDDLLAKPENKGRRVKLRFNKDWGNKDNWFSFSNEFRRGSDLFEPYLLSMSNRRNRADDIQFNFIEIGWHRWLFVGAYRILETNSQTEYDHSRGWEVAYAKAERLEEYEKYSFRLTLNYSLSRQWLLVNKRFFNEIMVQTILPNSYFDEEKAFPGYENISYSYLELQQYLAQDTWKSQLSAIYGVYVITDKKTGKLYVGSAYVNLGIYGRWSAYINSGYDKEERENSTYPNNQLRRLVRTKGITYMQENFQYTLLEIFPKTEVGKQKALNREIYWKNVFLSRQFGYNDN